MSEGLGENNDKANDDGLKNGRRMSETLCLSQVKAQVRKNKPARPDCADFVDSDAWLSAKRDYIKRLREYEEELRVAEETRPRRRSDCADVP